MAIKHAELHSGQTQFKIQPFYRVLTGLPQKFENTIPYLFHDQQCNFHDYLMHSLQPTLLAASSPR